MLCFSLFGFSVGLKFFMINDYNIQFVFYFIHLNLQVSSAFLVATMFSNVKTATVFGHITIFGSGLLGAFMFQEFVQDPLFPRIWLIIMECFPGFSLYRGLYEFGMSVGEGFADGTSGIKWGDLSHNGMKEVLIIVLVEWFIVVFVAYYIDQVISFGNCHNPLFYLRKKKHVPSRKPSLQRQGSKDVLGKHDVIEESEKVEEILGEPSAIRSYAIVCDRLAKVYPEQDGNPKKFAVKGLSLALPHGECFGMLGPNGAGKTSFISMECCEDFQSKTKTTKEDFRDPVSTPNCSACGSATSALDLSGT